MIFENPNALWLLLALPPVFLGIYFLGWIRRKEVAVAFPLILKTWRRKYLEKYAVIVALMVLLIIAVASPKIAVNVSATIEKTGEIVFLVDDSGSMGAQKDLDSPNRLERVKPILYNIIDRMGELGQVKIALFGFTNIARSLTPFVDKVDYPYLKESINKLLDIYSTPGEGTSFGEPIKNVIEKFSKGATAKLIILFSDGEPYSWDTIGMTDDEQRLIDHAVEAALNEGVKIITVGVGEKGGARIPIYDSNGKFSGSYSIIQKGVYYISYLEEKHLNGIASQTDGAYFFEDKLEGLIEYITENLDLANVDDANIETKNYISISSWFLFASLPLWVVFTRRYLLDW